VTRIALTAALLLATLSLSCGYQTTGSEPGPNTGYKWKSLYRDDIQTIAVPIFTNRDFTRNVEFDLTRAVIQKIEANTPYKVVPRTRADTILEGEITAVSSTGLSYDRRTATPQEQVVSVNINFIWKDLRSGRIIVQRQNFETAAAFYPTLGEGEWYGQQEVVEKLATSIVQELQADW